MRSGIVIATAILLTATAVAAQDCPLTYETYEISVPHTDIEVCPASMDVTGAYCRLALVAEVVTIFAFSEESDCLIAARSYFEDQFTVTID